MIQLIFTDILMVALGTMLYLIVVALPRVPEVPVEHEKKNFLERFAQSGIPERVDLAINNFLVKFLRKVKVFVLKLDNAASRHLQKINVDDGVQQPVIDFAEISGKRPKKKKEGTSLS
jgi:hypothetical protein